MEHGLTLDLVIPEHLQRCHTKVARSFSFPLSEKEIDTATFQSEIAEKDSGKMGPVSGKMA